MKNKTLYADLGMVLITIIWGYGFIASKQVTGYMSTYQIIFYRFLLSAIILCAVFFKEIKKISKSDIKKSLILGAFLCAGFLAQTEALFYTTVSKSAFLTTLNVIFVPIIVAFAHKKRIDGYSIIGCLLAFAGTGILTLNADFTVNFGDVLAFMCAIFYSFHIFFLGEFVKDSSSNVLSTGQVVAVVFFSFFVLLFTDGFVIPPLNLEAVAGIFYLAAFSTCFCFAVQTHCQKFTSQIKAVIIFSMEAVFASIFSVLIFKDEITVRFIVGSSIIFAAVIISSTRLEFLRRPALALNEKRDEA